MRREMSGATTHRYTRILFDVRARLSLLLRILAIIDTLILVIVTKTVNLTMCKYITWNKYMVICWITMCLTAYVMAYDPNDKLLSDILLPEGQFEAFYQKGVETEEQNAVRPPHLHGSFHQFKNPALVDAANSAAYGYRFDGKRRFNYN